jgi:hypothetical protein
MCQDCNQGNQIFCPKCGNKNPNSICKQCKQDSGSRIVSYAGFLPYIDKCNRCKKEEREIDHIKCTLFIGLLEGCGFTVELTTSKEGEDDDLYKDVNFYIGTQKIYSVSEDFENYYYYELLEKGINHLKSKYNNEVINALLKFNECFKK